MKNGIALKEGADGGRIVGVSGDTLTFGAIVGSDVDQKIWVEATNKWGTVRSKIVHLRLPDEQRGPKPAIANDVQRTLAEQDKLKRQHQLGMASSLKQMERVLDEAPPPLDSRSSIADGLKSVSGEL